MHSSTFASTSQILWLYQGLWHPPPAQIKVTGDSKLPLGQMSSQTCSPASYLVTTGIDSSSPIAIILNKSKHWMDRWVDG